MKLEDCYRVGYIMRSHGLKGEVTISIEPDSQANWENLKSIFIEKKSHLIPYFVESISVRNDKAFLKLEDVDNPEHAALLKGGSIYLPKKTSPKLAQGEFYYEEVIGFAVIDSDLG